MHILGFIKEVALPKNFGSFCDLEMLIAWTCLFFNNFCVNLFLGWDGKINWRVLQPIRVAWSYVWILKGIKNTGSYVTLCIELICFDTITLLR